jgi:tetratricopeptide (TPR) repeat protein
LTFLPTAARENALYSADLTELGKAFSFPLITFRHARSFRGGFITDVTAGGQTEKAHAAYKRAIDIAKMDDPSAQSASLLGDIGLLYAKFGDQAQAVHYTRMARAKAPSDVQLMYSEGQVYALLGQPGKAIPACRQAIAKGYSRKEVWNDPENAKLQSFPEFVKLVKSGTSK